MSGDFTFMKGNIDIIILCSLCDNDKYGYEIAKEIKEKTSNKYEIKQPTLYSYLKRLEDEGLIVSYWGEASNGGRRRYYTITREGREDCQSFVAEWQYQRNIMSDLVDDTAAGGKEISQKEATPLFGRKTNRRSRKNEVKSPSDEQDEILRKLRELSGENTDETTIATEATETVAETTQQSEPSAQPRASEQLSIFDAADEATDEEYVSPVTDYEEPVAPVIRDATPSKYREELSEADRKSRFEVKQDNAESFIRDFDTLAQEASDRQSDKEVSEGENYQHILMGVIGEQLDDVKELREARTTTYYTNHPAALEEVADDLAKEGIRTRIYNHATATYRPKQLIPLSKVLCKTSWISYFVPLVYFVILSLCSISIDNWRSPIITASALLLVPIAFTIYAFVDPTRKDKPLFNFKKMLLASFILSAIVVALAVAISLFGKIEFSNFAEVTNKILLSLGVVMYLPCFVVVYNYYYTKY